MAKGFWKKAFGPLGVKPTEMEEEDYFDGMDAGENAYDYPEDDSEEPAYEEPSFANRGSRRSKVIAMPDSKSTGAQMKMIIFRPTSYDETQDVIDNLKARKPIIVNLDEIDMAVAQRILDFISGAVYALGGDIKKAARNIFVVAPSNVEVSSHEDTADGAAFTLGGESYDLDDEI
ncbi:MAG: cell division protein SepF [Christensenellaceae bacterium]|nr:cell division protein SepF [Christensenellaceae bacterium]